MRSDEEKNRRDENLWDTSTINGECVQTDGVEAHKTTNGPSSTIIGNQGARGCAVAKKKAMTATATVGKTEPDSYTLKKRLC